MKILHIIPLFAIFMKSAMTSDSGTDPFQVCLDGRDPKCLRKLLEGNDDTLLKTRSSSLVGTNDASFIVSVINIGSSASDFILISVLNNGSEELIDDVLSKIDLMSLFDEPSQSKRITSRPAQLVALIKRIRNKKDKQKVIKATIGKMFDGNLTDGIDRLLCLLENEPSLTDVRDEAIRTVFTRAIHTEKAGPVNRFCVRPAITSQTYAEGLVKAARLNRNGQVFKRLLGNACKADLEAVKKRYHRHLSKDNPLQQAIKDEAVEGAPEGRKYDGVPQEAMVVASFVEDIMKASAVRPSDRISYILASYMAEKENVDESNDSDMPPHPSQPPMLDQPSISNSDGLGLMQTSDSGSARAILRRIEPSKFDLNVSLAEGWITKRTFENSIVRMPRALVTMIVVYIIGEHPSGERSDVEQQGSMKEGSKKTSTANIILSLSMSSGGELTVEEYLSELFEGLMQEKDYDGMRNIGRDLGDLALIKYVYPSITTTEQYKEHYRFLRDNNLLSNFLLHGETGLVRRVIAGFPEQEEGHIWQGDMRKALAESFNERDQYERFKGLLSAEEHVCKESNRCAEVLGRTSNDIYWFFIEISPAQNGISTRLKQFLTLHSQEFRVEYPVTHNLVCRELVLQLRNWSFMYPKAREMLTDLVGQPDLLSSKAITDVFLDGISVDDSVLENFLTHAWREAVEEYVIRGNNYLGRQRLWNAIVGRSPTKQLNPHFPPLPGELTRAIGEIPTKLMREKAWTEKNVPGYQEMVREPLRLVLKAFFPGVLVNIVFEYINLRPTATWLDIPALH